MTDTAAEVSHEVTRTVALIKRFIEGLGLDPERARVDVPGENNYGWSLMRGSAPMVVFVRAPRDTETTPMLRVVSPIVKIDALTEVALCRRLLELNGRGLGPCAFGLLDDRVAVIAERRTTDLEPDELSHLIKHVGTIGDHYDDVLVAEFGGARVGGDD